MFIGEDVDVATSPAVTAGGRTMWFEFLAVESDITVSASPWEHDCIIVSKLGGKRDAIYIPACIWTMRRSRNVSPWGVRLELWASADKIVTHPLPLFPLGLSSSK